jgi:hypothetical protein
MQPVDAKARGTNSEWLGTLGPPPPDRQAHGAEELGHLGAWSTPYETRKVRIVVVFYERSRHHEPDIAAQIGMRP